MYQIEREVPWLEERILVGGSQKEELALCRVVMKYIIEMKVQLSFLISDKQWASSRGENNSSENA